MTLPSLIAGIPNLFTINVETCAAKIFSLKLKLAIATIGRGTIKARNDMGNNSSRKKSFPNKSKTNPISTMIKENPEAKEILKAAHRIWINKPKMNNNQPDFSGLTFILFNNCSLFNQIKKILIKGTKNPWL
jgi:hypothetical protein